MVIEPGEFSEIEASHSFDSIILRAEALVDHLVDQVEVLLLVEKNAVLHPEFLRVAWTPSQLFPLHLIFELVDGAEGFLILVEILEHLLKHFVDVVIYPMSVLKFNDQVQGINVTQVLLANWNLLEVIEKHQHYSCNFFPTEEIENFGNFFDDGKCVVLEVFMSKLVITQDPENDTHVVANLWLLEAWTFKKITNHLKALGCAEFPGKLVSLQKGH